MSIRGKSGTRQTHSIGGNVMAFLFLVLVGLFMLLPFVYSNVQSLKPMEELFVFPPKFYVRHPTLDNFRDLLLRTNNMWVPLERYLFNSVLLSVAGTLLSVVISAMAAYPLAKYVFPGSRVFEKLVVLSLLFVYEVTAIPQYILLSRFGMIDTLWALLLPALSSTLGLYLMKNFMTHLPDEMMEAARVDGAGHGRIFTHIVLPNIKPALVTVVILTFQTLWNRGTGSYIFTEQLKNLPTLLSQISTTNTVSTAGVSAAATVILMLPPIVVFVSSQSQVVETMAYSGIKG